MAEERESLAGNPTHIAAAWSIKEAVLKALGTGMALSPRDVVVTEVTEGRARVRLGSETAARLEALGGASVEVRWDVEEGLVTSFVRLAA